MTSRRHLILAVFVALAILLGGGLALVWPNYKRTDEMNDRIKGLYAKSRDLKVQDATLAALKANLDQVMQTIDEELKVTTTSANVADLMGRLSLRPDGVTVLDQSFTTGQPGAAVPGSEMTVQATPLTVEITGRFDAIFALIRSVETMNRLIRVSSVNLDSTNVDQADALAAQDSPIITANIGLEVVYDPGPEEGE